MASNLVLEIDRREQTNKNAVRRLRNSGTVPAVLYGGDLEPEHISLPQRDIAKAMQSDTFFSQIIDLKLNELSQQVVIRDLQRHPSTNQVMHIDFLRIQEDQEIQVSIPIRFENEDVCQGVRLGGGIVSHNLIEVEVSCLPRDLPEFIAVDIEHLELNDSIHLTDLTLPEGVSIVALMQGDMDRNIAVVSVQAPKGTLEDEEMLEEDDEILDELEEGAEEDQEEDSEG